MTARALFVTNNGLGDPLGVSQILPYLEGLARKGHQIACVSVEQSERAEEYRARVAPRLHLAGITHSPIVRAPAGPQRAIERFTIPMRLARALRSLRRSFQPDLVHCRSYMPLPAVLPFCRRSNIPLLFDMRGFWIDQRIEGGGWNPRNPAHAAILAFFRRLENQAYARSTAIVVLTHDAEKAVRTNLAYDGAMMAVVPCSVDTARFAFDPGERERLRSQWNIRPNDPLLVWLGSTGTVYRVDIAYRLLATVRRERPGAKLLLLGDHDVPAHLAAAEAQGTPLLGDALITRRLPHEKVPGVLSAADVGLSLCVATPSSLGVSATKTGEYLSCGLPVVTNRGLGDIDRIVTDGRNGWVLPDFGDEAVDTAAAQIVRAGFADRAEIRSAASEWFDMDRAIDTYDRLYRAVAGR